MPYAVMVPTIALYHSGVGAVVFPVSLYLAVIYLLFVLFYLMLV